MRIPQNNVKTIIKSIHPELPFTDELAEPSCPFSMYLGFAINTPQGEVEWDSKINNYALYQRVLTGSDSVSVLWDKANKINPTTKKIEKNVGQINIFYITSESVKFTQAQLPSSNDLVSAQAVESFEAYTKGEVFTANDSYKLHMFPKSFGRTLFLAEIIDSFKGGDGNILWQKISFQSLQNELATSGLAIEQFVHFGAMGMEYAMPIWDGEKQEIVVDKDRSIGGITDIQIEFYGNVAPISFMFAGRTMDADVDQNDLIAPCIMLPPKASSFSNSAAPSTDYTVVKETEIQVDTRWKNYKAAISAAANSPFEKREFEGTFKMIPLADTGYDSMILRNHTSTEAINIENTPSYNNPFYASATGGAKLKAFTKTNAISVLWRNYFTTQHIKDIPTSSKTSIAFNLTQVPILGSLINQLTFGLLPDTPITTGGYPTANHLPCLVEKTSLDHGSIVFSAPAGEKVMPLDWFRNEDTGSMAAALSTKSKNTCFRFTTSRWFADKGIEVSNATSAEARTYLQAFDSLAADGKQFNDNTSVVHIDGKLEEYIISQAYIKVIGAADYRITGFNRGKPVWTGRYQTRGKRSATGSVHQIQHEMILDPINRIEGASELMGLTKIDLDKQFLQEATTKFNIHKHLVLEGVPDHDKYPIDTIPLADVYQKTIKIPLTELIGSYVPQAGDEFLIAGSFNRGGLVNKKEDFTYKAPANGVGFGGDTWIYNEKGHDQLRFGVVCKVVGTNLDISIYDTGEYHKGHSSYGRFGTSTYTPSHYEQDFELTVTSIVLHKN